MCSFAAELLQMQETIRCTVTEMLKNRDNFSVWLDKDALICILIPMQDIDSSALARRHIVNIYSSAVMKWKLFE